MIFKQHILAQSFCIFTKSFVFCRQNNTKAPLNTPKYVFLITIFSCMDTFYPPIKPTPAQTVQNIKLQTKHRHPDHYKYAMAGIHFCLFFTVYFIRLSISFCAPSASVTTAFPNSISALPRILTIRFSRSRPCVPISVLKSE